MTENDDTVRFQILGETPRHKLHEVLQVLGGLGTHVAFSSELPLVSPSIAVELVEDVNGLSVPAITKSSVTEFLVAEGANVRGAKSLATSFVWCLEVHALHDHARYQRPDDTRLNYYGHELKAGCDCPLLPAFSRNALMSGVNIVGLDVQSLVALAELPAKDIQAKIKSFRQNFGLKKAELVKRLAARIRLDTRVVENES